MNELFPIIRRVRRPLVVGDRPPVVVGNVEPVKANAEGGVQKAEQDLALRAEQAALPHPGPLPPALRAGEGEQIERPANANVSPR